GDKIILPRKVHKSALNALVHCGAIPLNVDMSVEPRIVIAHALEKAAFERAIEENPQAVAVFINKPTYYGICSDQRSLT
ncbi:arginine decarboxylase, partial [Streptococcus suis]